MINEVIGKKKLPCIDISYRCVMHLSMYFISLHHHCSSIKDVRKIIAIFIPVVRWSSNYYPHRQDASEFM